MPSTPVDTGPLVALFDKRDKWHDTIKNFLAGHEQALTTSWPVLTEVSFLLEQHVWLDCLTWLEQGAVSIADTPELEIKRILVLSRKYKDLPMDFADASLIVLAELQNQADIITIDSDFDVYRFGVNRKFNNLLRSWM